MDIKGKVYLIGAGPGDPDLITVRGKELLAEADVVIYDTLINPVLLSYCPGSAELIYVGKKIGHKEFSQKEINNIMLKKCRESTTVVRLKGGDPFVFGRGGEEAKYLIQKGVEVEVVPGISSVIAVPAYSGVPVTHRDYNSSFAVFTGHESNFSNPDESNLRYLKDIKTLVFLMGLNNIKNIMLSLIKAGKSTETPVLIVTNGTLPTQKSLSGTVSDIADKLDENPDITTPAVIIVGDIVSLRKYINWFEKKPLFGKKIVVTRDISQINEFEKDLNLKGAEVIRFPVIDVRPLKDRTKIDQSIKNIHNYEFLIFTSVNGVRFFFDALSQKNKDSRVLGGKKIITIGEKTSGELKKFNIISDYTPKEFIAESIIELCEKIGVVNKKILIPRARVAREILPEKLKELGADADVVAFYETLKPDYNQNELIQLRENLLSNSVNFVTFTSSSTVTNFFEILGKDRELYKKCMFACIGPVTAKTLKSYGFTPDIVADTYTVKGLTDKLASYYRCQN